MGGIRFQRSESVLWASALGNTLSDFERVFLAEVERKYASDRRRRCRRLVTADAMGMAKERDRTGVVVDGTGNEVVWKRGVPLLYLSARWREGAPSPLGCRLVVIW